MADFVLSCCSTADLTKEHFQQRDISYICFHYALDGVDYPDDLGETMPFDKFYAAMANGAETRTSQVNISEFVDYFTPFLEQGKDILHVCLSSGLSGVSNSAENAARIVRERYPDRKIYIVDSLGASSGYGLLMDRLADLRDEGVSIDGVRDWAEAHKLELHHWFFSTDLTFYVKGGRISKVAGVFGGLLDICPLLNMDNLGRLIPRSKIRGKKRVMKEIVARMEEHAQGGLDYSGKCYISQSACYDDARAVADAVRAGQRLQIRGFRVCIFSDNGPEARNGAFAAQKLFEETYPGVKVYMDYKIPYFVVSVGDCLSNEEAVILKGRVTGTFPKAFLKNEEFPISNLLD